MNEFFKEKKVLVTGGNGLIGINLIKKLEELGAWTRSTSYRKELRYISPGVEYLNVNLEIKEDCLKATEGIDYVFMCAANTSGAEVIEKKPLTHLTPNIIMNAQMLESAYINGVKKFCFISSNTVYPEISRPAKEEDAGFEFFEKYHIVAWMKRFSEIMCDMYSKNIKHPMETLIVRPGNLYGPYDKFTWKESKVIAALIRKAVEKRRPFEVWGDGKDIKDFLYIDDFIEGLLKAFAKEGVTSPINIASGRKETINEVISILCKNQNINIADIKYLKDKPTMIPVRQISIERALNSLDWFPKHSLEEGIRKTISWYNSYYIEFKPEEKEDADMQNTF